MEKSRDAFRTISEVAGWLDVPTHVLRFWESRFSQIKPVKRAGGRRYYRPSDMSLIGGIKTLLHDQGMTIRGVQKMLREQGIKHVSSFSPPLHPDDATEAHASDDTVIEGTTVPLERQERPVSIPAPAARATHGAEQTEEKPETEGPNEVSDDQPDMFPEAADQDQTDMPMFAHRRSDPEVVDAAAPSPEAPPPAPTIPPTPQVPDRDPADDDGEDDVILSLAARLLALQGSDIPQNKDQLGPVAARLKDLRARMAE